MEFRIWNLEFGKSHKFIAQKCQLFIYQIGGGYRGENQLFPLRRGFTLIEVLIVIAIVSLLSVAAVSSFGSSRQQAGLDIATDSLITAFKEQSQKAKSGRFDGSQSGSVDQLSASSCFGLRFENQTVQYLTLSYISADVDGRVDVCEGQESLKAYEGFGEMEMKKILVDGDEVQTLDLLFKPPFAKVFMKKNSELSSDFHKLVFVFGFKNATGVRMVELDAVTGMVQRIHNL